MELVKIYENGKLLIDLEVKGKAFHSRYNTVHRVEAVPGAEFPSEAKLQEYAISLQTRYPERGFSFAKTETIDFEKAAALKRRIEALQRRRWLRWLLKPLIAYYENRLSKVSSTTLYIISQQAHDGINLVFDPSRKTIYLAKEDLEKDRKLVNYLTFRALGSLGLVKSKYERMVH
jgi:hypothetical protein